MSPNRSRSSLESKAWAQFLTEHRVHIFADRQRLRDVLSPLTLLA